MDYALEHRVKLVRECTSWFRPLPNLILSSMACRGEDMEVTRSWVSKLDR